ncbi:MAG: aminotransferase class V-fold PLP-dependent enzyme [Halobacteriovoraceae bacterium]|jgi:cysteine desulfurase / selenocysteine lyase|nr:aminotransferase class V-fold PLP-dependent enzyme [Halobacteriovoraceae bacterium]MBT5095790.1 aminotransferase class V-fold PLP-dependent enzyme [Halobacteriovoraceae bacterium]
MNWSQLRQNYPATQKGAYLMNAAIGAPHKRVFETSLKWNKFTLETAAIDDIKFFECLEAARKTCADFLKVEQKCIGFAPNTGTNMNILAGTLKTKTSKRKVISTTDEFPSTTLPWLHAGFEVDFVSSVDGFLGIEQFIEKIDDDTAAVVVSAVQYLTGFRLDLEALGLELKKRNIPFIVNATQMLGVFEVHPEKFHATALSASCHKWLAAGIGQAILYLSPEWCQNFSPPFVGWSSVENYWDLANDRLALREEASIMEIGTLCFERLAALQTAIEVVLEVGLPEISQRILDLSSEMHLQLSQLGLKIHSYRKLEKHHTGIISFSIENHDAVEVAAALKEKSVFINNRKGRLRASISYYNNSEDIERLIVGLKEIIKG